jgi:hypothetical protein
MRVFSYNPGGLVKLAQCGRKSSRDYILTLIGGVEYNSLSATGSDFICYDNNWWVPSVSGSTYPSVASIPICARGLRTGSDTDHLFTLNSAELATGFSVETSGFRIWSP